MIIKRDYYLNQLIASKHNGLIKIVTGLRRSGKSYLLFPTSHIVLDQLYSYSPGTNGFQAMALGRVAGTGAQPEFYEYIGETQSRPIFTLSPLEDTETRLRELILNPEKMPAMGAEGRRIVEKDNDVAIVADRFLNHWNNILK